MQMSVKVTGKVIVTMKMWWKFVIMRESSWKCVRNQVKISENAWKFKWNSQWKSVRLTVKMGDEWSCKCLHPDHDFEAFTFRRWIHWQHHALSSLEALYNLLSNLRSDSVLEPRIGRVIGNYIYNHPLSYTKDVTLCSHECLNAGRLCACSISWYIGVITGGLNIGHEEYKEGCSGEGLNKDPSRDLWQLWTDQWTDQWKSQWSNPWWVTIPMK